MSVERKPIFGDRMRGIYASESNPQRDGFYVRTVRRTGRMNPGKFYELTDKKGAFWSYPASSVTFIEPSPPYPWCRQPSVCRGTCPMDPSCGE